MATLEPRKNLGALVAAFKLLDRDDLRLLLAGSEGWGRPTGAGPPEVVRLGFVDDDDLARLYGQASAFVYPSRFEGFGIPILEAMASGTPVVASSHESMDEACGTAAMRADPESPEAIAVAVEHALGDPGTLVARGLAHAARFTWLETGRAILRELRGGLMLRVGLDVSPLEQTRAGTRSLPRGARSTSGHRPRSPRAPRRQPRPTPSIATPSGTPSSSGLARRRRLDVLHCPTFRGPLSSPPCPLVVTVHDLAVLHHPETFNQWTRQYSRLCVSRVVRAARLVIAVSESTKAELVDVLSVPDDRIRVVPNGVAPIFRPEGPAEQDDYVLAVGTLEPRKNLQRLARATRQPRRRAPRGRSVPAGAASTWAGACADSAACPTPSSARLYRGARCLAYPSLHEGFGLPVIEAMACGTPVVTSCGGATEEVAGGAAVLVDPLDVESIANGIGEAARRKSDLRALGLERARAFHR